MKRPFSDTFIFISSPHFSSSDTNRQWALWVSLAQHAGPSRNCYAKLPSHLDGSQPESTFSTGTKPGQRGSASRCNCHALQHSLLPLIWAFTLIWVTSHTPTHMHYRHCCGNVYKVSIGIVQFKQGWFCGNYWDNDIIDHNSFVSSKRQKSTLRLERNVQIFSFLFF